MKVGAELVFMVKKNTKGCCKEAIGKIPEDWPVGYYLVLRGKPMVPGRRPFIAMGYNYNVQKFLSFIVTYNTGSKQAGPNYLFKYPNQFNHVSICPVACPLVMSNFFLLLMRLSPTTNQGSLIWY